MRQLTPFMLALLVFAAARAGEVRGWRGDGSGCYPRSASPIHWDIDEGTNILWRTAVGEGESSPVFAAERVFLTVQPDRLLCLRGRDGKVLWSRRNGYSSLPAGTKVPAKPPASAERCGYATPTPVTDGKRVWACYGTGIVVCYDITGKRQWVRFLNVRQLTEFGRSASPVLADGKLLVSIGGLIALDAATGKTLWHARGAKPGYGTPAIARVGETALAVTPGGDCVRLSDGRILATGLARTDYSSPVVAGRVVCFAGPPIVAVQLPAKMASPLQIQKLWTFDDAEGQFVASPVCHDDVLYCLSNEGTLYALDAKAGRLVFEKELDVPSASGRPGVEPANLYASLTLAGKHLILFNDIGNALVLAPGRKYRELARNYLDAGSGASPVPGGGLLLLRGGKKLYGIGRTRQPASQPAR